MIDALGAQRSLEVVDEPESQPEKKSFMDEEVEFGKKEMAVSMVLGLVLGVVGLGALMLLVGLKYLPLKPTEASH